MNIRFNTPTERWFRDLYAIWINRRPEGILEIVAHDFKYYEDPFEPPFTSPNDLLAAWNPIKDQDIRFLEITFLGGDRQKGFARWQLELLGEDGISTRMDGAYFIQLDREGKCREFRQWWNESRSAT